MQDQSELVARLKQKDGGAYSQLYDQYAGSLLSVILRYIDTTEAAEDMLQEVFMKIYHKIEQYDATKGRLFTWMIQLTRNHCIDFLRSTPGKSLQKNRSLSDFVVDPTMDHSFQLSIDQIGLKRLVEALPTEQRQIIDLMYFEGMSQTEVADFLGIPLGTVKTRSRNAIINLRAKFTWP